MSSSKEMSKFMSKLKRKTDGREALETRREELERLNRHLASIRRLEAWALFRS